MTYKCKEDAKMACESYLKKVVDLGNELDIFVVSSDECCSVDICADYIDENGKR